MMNELTPMPAMSGFAGMVWFRAVQLGWCSAQSKTFHVMVIVKERALGCAMDSVVCLTPQTILQGKRVVFIY
jgi:hypothetical protein